METGLLGVLMVHVQKTVVGEQWKDKDIVLIQHQQMVVMIAKEVPHQMLLATLTHVW